MAEAALVGAAPKSRVDLDAKGHASTPFIIVGLLALGVGYGLYGLLSDIGRVNETVATGAYALLGLALLIALGFEFVNGFHDTANAVATVIYTHSLKPVTAVIWSGAWNFIGVMVSTGAVAYSIITILPLDVILNASSIDGRIMIFALLIAAVVWNLGTWWVGIPNSSTHALIGSLLGVAVAHQLLSRHGDAASGVEWKQAFEVLKALLFSPLIGFAGAWLVLTLMKAFLKNPRLFEEPKDDSPPPVGIRSLLIFTCTAVSFAHGGNDGQKGMGLIMLILIGVAPTAFALNRTMPDSSTPGFLRATAAAQSALVGPAAAGAATPPPPVVVAARATVQGALEKHNVDASPALRQALAVMAGDIGQRAKAFGSIRRTPATATNSMRNDMYMINDAVRRLGDDKAKAQAQFGAGGAKALGDYHKALDAGVRYIPTWVKVAVAVALGLGTMVGWKRIVMTVGEKIGKDHLTYGMGAAAELVAAATILLAGFKGAPVSTTHILSSGVAGSMVANGSGLQWSTVRAIATAWVLTLPAAILIAAGLYTGLRFLVPGA